MTSLVSPEDGFYQIGNEDVRINSFGSESEADGSRSRNSQCARDGLSPHTRAPGKCMLISPKCKLPTGITLP